MNTIPWYRSQIILQQVVALIAAVIGLLGITTDIDITTTVTAVFAAITALVPVATILTRVFKPSPNLTLAAELKEKELIAKGKIKKGVL
jgi:hypothetical protein